MTIGMTFENALFECGGLFKHPAFKKEKEWRLITARRDFTDKAFDFREGKSMLTPYFKLKISSDKSWAHKVAGVKVGPCPHPKSAKMAVMGLLVKELANPAVLPKVTNSIIPYRSW